MKKHIIFLLLTVLLPFTLSAQTNPVMGTLLLNGKEIAAEYNVSGTEASLGSGRNACIPHYSKGRVIVPKTITVDGNTYNVTAVSAMAFRLCTGITFVQLPEGVTRIGDFAFKGCSGLVEVSLPSTLQSIGSGAFIGLSHLRAIHCTAATPPEWEYNDVFCRHEGGIGSTLNYSNGNTTATLYVPTDRTEAYRNSAFSDAGLGWNTPDGWGYFKTIKEANDYETEWGLGISTPLALENFRQRVNAGDTFNGKIVKLEADIDMTNHKWESGIGGTFKGTFDGQGHTISNLNIKVPENSNINRLGFFSDVLDNTITNVRFDNFYVISQSESTLHTGIVAGSARNGTLSNIYVSNSSVYGYGHVGTLAGDAWYMTVNKCVADNSTVIHTTCANITDNDYGVGGLVGDTRKATITNCAVINSRYPTSKSKSCIKGPFVGVNSSYPEDASTIDYCYCTSDVEYNAFVPVEETCFYTHGEHVVMYGQEVWIPEQMRWYPLTVGLMKNFMYLVTYLGLDNWVYCIGQYPLPDCFEDRYPVEANHFSLRPATLTTPRPNALTPTVAISADDWKTGAYRNASFITSSLYIDDGLSYNDREVIPIGTATIECTNGVRYERTLTAPENGKRTTEYLVYQTDENGMIVYDDNGHRIPTGETRSVEETVYEPTAYCFNLPYPLTFSNGIHLYQPAGVTVEDDAAQATFVEKTDGKAEAWQPYYAVVDAATVSLSTEEHVTLPPANNNAVDAGNGYFFAGTHKKENRNQKDAYLLQNDKTWRKEGSDILPFRAYFYSTNESQAAQITTFATLMLKNNEDNSEVIENNRGVTTNVTLQDRTLYKDGSWNTLCLPFNVALEGSPLEGATVMKLDATGTYATDKHTGFDASDGTLYLYFKDVSTLEAGKPYIVKWTKANDYDDDHSKYDIANPVFSDVTVTSTAPATVSAKNSGLNTVEFIGTYGPAALTGGDKGCLYLGADNMLYYPSADMTVRAFRAYFHVDLAGQPSGIRAFVLNFGDEETGIFSATLNDKGQMINDKWYSLDGRKLNGKPTTKGLYINNGKKVVIK